MAVRLRGALVVVAARRERGLSSGTGRWSGTGQDVLQSAGNIQTLKMEDRIQRGAQACIFYLDKSVKLGCKTVIIMVDADSNLA